MNAAAARSHDVRLAARWGNVRGLTGRLLAACGLLVAIVATAFVILILAINDLRESANLARTTRDTLIALDQVEKLVVDLETGLRGYVITGNDDYLAPWDEAQAVLPERTIAMEQSVADEADQSRRAAAITRDVNAYVVDYGLPLIAAVERGDATQGAAATEDGKRQVDALRAAFEDFRSAERDLLNERQDRADSSARRAVTVSLVGLAGSIVLIALFAGYLTRAIVDPVRRAAHMARQLAGGDLSTRMPTTDVAEIGALESAFNEMAGSLERNRDELADLASEQAALRRVATIVAEGATPEDVFSAVAQELAHRLGADITKILRYESDATVTVVGGWSVLGIHIPLGTRLGVDGTGIAGTIHSTRQPARAEGFEGPPGSISACFAEQKIRCGIGSPIVVEGALWGAAIAGSTDPDALPAGSEDHIGAFTELVATAIANAESRAELAASRARVVAAADNTRRQVERDLHDGAQQRLVALGLRLRAAAETIPPTSDAREELEQVGTELNDVLDDLRELSRGIHPAILSEGGLGPAIRTLARRSAIPVDFAGDTNTRLPEHIEVAAYYVVSEALTNAAKHADASGVNVSLATDNATLQIAVRDDGVGGADFSHGSGLIGLKDRVEAAGGAMTVESRPGEGTAVLVDLPIHEANGQPS